MTGLSDIENLFLNDFVYLCAERFGPRSSFELGPKKDRLEIGIFGQFSLSSYHDNQDKPANNQKFARNICSHLINPEKR